MLANAKFLITPIIFYIIGSLYIKHNRKVVELHNVVKNAFK